MQIRSIVFDLDDTLYLERDYVRSGIQAVGRWLLKQSGVTGFSDLAQHLWDHGQRSFLFDTTLDRLGIEPSATLVAELVDVYHFHEPRIALAPDAARFLTDPGHYRFALISDGLAISQRRKVAALQLERFALDPLILTADLGNGFGKPHGHAFELVEAMHGGPPAAIVYVADNPAKDFVAPRALGWRTVQIDRPEAVHPREPPSASFAAELRIESLAELRMALARLSTMTP